MICEVDVVPEYAEYMATRLLRHVAHVSFDRLWKRGLMTRREAYRRLAAELNLPLRETHLGRIRSHAVFRHVVIWSNGVVGTPVAADDFPDDLVLTDPDGHNSPSFLGAWL
ncbi:MAG: zinc-finger-containing protein [Thermoplasmata archaeon]